MHARMSYAVNKCTANYVSLIFGENLGYTLARDTPHCNRHNRELCELFFVLESRRSPRDCDQKRRERESERGGGKGNTRRNRKRNITVVGARSSRRKFTNA